MTKIKKPEWFDLKKYSKSKTRELAYWADNLRERVQIIYQLDGELDIYANDGDYFINIFRDQGFIIKETDPLIASSVESLCAGYVNDLYKEIPEEIRGNLDVQPDLEFYEQNEERSSPVGVGDLETCYLKVDINAPVQTILDDFKTWLIDEKEAINDKKTNTFKQKKINKVTVAKMSEWEKYKIIPYLDLLIWMKKEKVLVKQSILGEWLFSQDNFDDTTETFRKSTKVKAEAVIDIDYVWYISNQGGHLAGALR